MKMEMNESMEKTEVTDNTDVTGGTEMIQMVDTDKKKNKKKIKPWMVFTAIVAVGFLVLIGVMLKQLSGMSVMGTPVETTEAQRGSISQTVDTSGTVVSEECKTYFADVTAKINEVSVAEGQSVKKGDLLISYDTSDLELAMKQSEIETKISTYGADAALIGINTSQQKAAEAATNYEDAKKYVAHYTECVGEASGRLQEATKLAEQQKTIALEIEGYTKTLEKDPGNKKTAKALKNAQKEYEKVSDKLKDYDVAEIQSSLEACSADLAEYKALLKEYEMTKEGDPAASVTKAQQAAVKESAQFAKDNVASQLALAQEGVKADFDGVVSEVAAVEGQTAAEGMQLFKVHNTNALKLALSVTKYDMQKLEIGQVADITINDNKYTGVVSNISRIAAVNASGTTVVSVDIHIDNPDEKIVLGMEGKVSIQTAEESDILMIPSSCVNYSNTGVFCYVVSDGVIEKREIEIGISDAEFMQVLSGLSEGDKVVTSVTGTIQEGMPAMAVDAASMTGENASAEETASEETTEDEKETEE